jgi:tripartite-type tricarboxylate transporter receptor subunit TctC
LLLTRAWRDKCRAVSLPPDVPRVAESGYPGFEPYDSEGIIAPANTPAPIIVRLNGGIDAILGTLQVALLS